MILPITTPSASTSKSSSFHSPDGREAEARLRIRLALTTCGFGASALVPEIELGVREQREAELARPELAPLHSITSSARLSSVG